MSIKYRTRPSKNKWKSTFIYYAKQATLKYKNGLIPYCARIQVVDY